MIDRDRSTLLVIDFQSRLMPVIEARDGVVANAARLMEAAELFRIPTVITEQNAKGLGATVPQLHRDGPRLVHKMTFDACRMPEFLPALPDRPDLVVAGCETHVCVMQTVLGLLDAGRRVFAVRDAMGSRHAENKEAALHRMERNGAEIVTTEMVLFEWLADAREPQLRRVLDLVK